LEKIDFVLTWVDGSDEKWLEEKSKYSGERNSRNEAQHYRDWDILVYWFRMVEKYAPWVNKIHFVTCGQVPSWLNTKNPKLNLVDHKDYIPSEYLPTFSSHVIELFFNKIDGISDSFVYFNDDFFINDYLSPSDFFEKGSPKDSLILSNLSPFMPGDPFVHYLVNDIAVINNKFDRKNCMISNLNKWFSLKYGKMSIKNILLCNNKLFSAFYNFHGPQPYRKQTYDEVWKEYGDLLNNTASHKFRDRSDVNQYVFRYWHLAKGDFVPRRTNVHKMYTIGINENALIEDLKKNIHKTICINDTVENIDFENKKQMLLKTFNDLYPEKSSFEN